MAKWMRYGYSKRLESDLRDVTSRKELRRRRRRAYKQELKTMVKVV